MADKLICEVCNKNEAIGVACVPMVPISVAYCTKCLEANAHPWDILVSITASCCGLKNCGEEWKFMVEDTCRYLHRSLLRFKLEVFIERLRIRFCKRKFRK